jgi:outer membrane receptor protein involved in Fe transport
VRSFDESDDLEVYSAALEWEVEPTARTGLVLGYGHSWLAKDQGTNANGPQALLGAYWDVVPSLRLRASAARKIRFPSIRQLYDVDGGNQDLEAERSWNFEVGVTEQLPGGLELDVAAYLMNVHDYIERIPPDDLFENNDRYRFRGVDVSLSAHPLDPLEVRLFTSFLDSENRSSGAEQDELQNRPRVRYGGELQYQLPLGFAARVAVSRVQDQIVLSRTEPITRYTLDDYTLVDLKLSKTILDEGLELYVGVNNVTDEDYEQAYALPQAGRVFFGGITGRF